MHCANQRRYTFRQYRALKFVVSKPPNSYEKEVFHAVSNSSSHSGRAHVLRLLDSFTVHGKNGVHDVFVTEVVGLSLLRVTTRCELPIDVAKKVTTQFLSGLDYLHSCGVVHGGKSCPSHDALFVTCSMFVNPSIRPTD